MPVAEWTSQFDTTGIKVGTNSVPLNLSTAAEDSLHGGIIGCDNTGHMEAQPFDIGLGNDSWIEFSGGAPAFLNLVCGAECQISLEGDSQAADNHWTSRTAGDEGTPDAVTAQARSGSYSFRFLANSTNGLSKLGCHLNTPVGFQYIRGYLYLPDVGPVDEFAIWQSSPSSTGAWVVVTTGGVLRLLVDTTYSSTNDLTLSTNTWYGFEVSVDQGVGAKWRVWTSGGGWTTSETVVDADVTIANVANIGLCTAMGAADLGTFELFMDDIAINGDVGWVDAFYDVSGTNGVSAKVLRLDPESDGTHSFDTTGDFIDAGGDIAVSDTDVWESIDTPAMEANELGVEAVNNDSAEYIEVIFGAETVEDDPRGVQLTRHDRKQSGATGQMMDIHVSDDGITFYDTKKDITAAAGEDHFLSEILALPSDPPTAWTRADINGLVLRQFQQVNTRLNAVCLEVEWTGISEEAERVPYYRPMKQLIPT